MQPVMIEVSGAEQMADFRSTPLWFKTRVYRKGRYLYAVTCMVLGTETKVIHTRVDMAPIAKAIMKMAKNGKDFEVDSPHVGFKFNPIKRKDKSKRTGGMFGRRKGIGGVVFRTSKNKLVQKTVNTVYKVSRTAGDIATSKPFRGILAGTSVALAATGVGAPAAAALAGANVALNAAAAYKKQAEEVGEALGKVKAFRDFGNWVKGVPKSKRAKISVSPQAIKLKAEAGKSVAFLNQLKSPAGKAKLKKLKEDSEKAKEQFKVIAHTAKFSKNPIERDQAKKLARIIKIAAQTRARVKAIAEKNAGGLPGIFIDQRGRLKKGRFARTLKKAGSEPGLLYNPEGSNKRGRFLQQKSYRKKLAAARKEARKAAKRKAIELARVKRGADRENKKDIVKAKAAVRRAKNSGMSKKDRLRLVQGLVGRIKKKGKIRKAAVQRSRDRLKVAIRKAKANPFASSQVAGLNSSNLPAIQADRLLYGPYEIGACSCQERVGYDCIRVAGAYDFDQHRALEAVKAGALRHQLNQLPGLVGREGMLSY